MLRYGAQPSDRFAGIDSLSERERTVLHHLSSGECDKSIAAAMNISDSTVRVHVRSLLKKLGARSRLEAALHAVGALQIQPRPEGSRLAN
ncbi:LuxR C-terminal-related transcriptional regulator [Paracoccus isoporae]|nr:LuxR C-terminal-related transcriptional regulator [Paracoccus isoporae]